MQGATISFIGVFDLKEFLQCTLQISSILLYSQQHTDQQKPLFTVQLTLPSALMY